MLSTTRSSAVETPKYVTTGPSAGTSGVLVAVGGGGSVGRGVAGVCAGRVGVSVEGEVTSVGSSEGTAVAVGSAVTIAVAVAVGAAVRTMVRSSSLHAASAIAPNASKPR
jgi:hypothetical protein